MLTPVHINAWKTLDLTSKYAQLKTLRTLSQDISFVHISAQLLALVELRTKNLCEDLVSLHDMDLVSKSLPLDDPESTV